MDVKKLISEMTLEEKASLCSGSDFWHTKGKTPNRPLHRAFTASKNTLIRRLGQLLTEKIGKG